MVENQKGLDTQEYSYLLSSEPLDSMTVIGKIRSLSINDRINLLEFLRKNNISVIKAVKNGSITHVDENLNEIFIPTFNVINEIFRSLFRSGFFDGLIESINFPHDNESGICKIESTGNQISFDEISIEMLRKIAEFNNIGEKIYNILEGNNTIN